MAKSSQDKPMIVPSLPEETALVARSVFNIENVYLTIGDQLDSLLDDISLSDLDPGKIFHPGALTQLAQISIFQFAEDLADRPACSALAERMDWKYALHLPIRHPRLDPAFLCRFRQSLIGHSAGQQTFQSLLDRFAGVGLLGRDKRKVPAALVLEYVCRLNQMDRFHEEMCQAIEVLACRHPEVLRALAQPHWYHRYQERKGSRSRSASQQRVYAQALGTDARHLLQTLATMGLPSAEGLPEVRHLAAVWEKQYRLQGATVICRDASCEACPWLVGEGRCHLQEPAADV